MFTSSALCCLSWSATVYCFCSSHWFNPKSVARRPALWVVSECELYFLNWHWLQPDLVYTCEETGHPHVQFGSSCCLSYLPWTFWDCVFSNSCLLIPKMCVSLWKHLSVFLPLVQLCQLSAFCYCVFFLPMDFVLSLCWAPPSLHHLRLTLKDF